MWTWHGIQQYAEQAVRVCVVLRRRHIHVRAWTTFIASCNAVHECTLLTILAAVRVGGGVFAEVKHSRFFLSAGRYSRAGALWRPAVH